MFPAILIDRTRNRIEALASLASGTNPAGMKNPQRAPLAHRWIIGRMI
jgi:hypothetical protein